MRPQHTCKHIQPAVRQFASCWNPDSETQCGTLKHQRQSFTRLLIISYTKVLLKAVLGVENNSLSVASSHYNIYAQNNSPNWYISPADIITPTLPRVSANTWRNTPERREKITKGKKNMQEYTVNIKRRFTSLPLLSKNLQVYFGRFLAKKFWIRFTVFPHI